MVILGKTLTISIIISMIKRENISHTMTRTNIKIIHIKSIKKNKNIIKNKNINGNKNEKKMCIYIYINTPSQIASQHGPTARRTRQLATPKMP